MKKLRNDLTALKKKIAHHSVKDKFKQADKALGIAGETGMVERIMRKSYAVTQTDLKNIQTIKEKCLNKRVVLNSSWIIRMALNLVSKLSEDELIKASRQVQNIPIGRPKK
jgi:hypothetical protein